MLMSKTYGTWSARYRMTRGAGVKYAFLLWPQSGSRPEIDFAEGDKHDPQRAEVNATYHPAAACNRCIQLRVAADMTRWHTLAVHWTASGFTFTIDGRQWGHVSAHDAKPSHLAIQTWQFAPGPSTLLEVADVNVS
jgi:hypothetical protein